MSLVGRRRQAAADARRRAARRARQTTRTERPCAMRGCRRTTARPLGYCDTCWNGADER